MRAASKPAPTVQSSSSDRRPRARMFRDRCRVLEAAPHDILITFGAYLPTVDVIAAVACCRRQRGVGLGNRAAHRDRAEQRADDAWPPFSIEFQRHDRRKIRVPAPCPTYYFPEVLCPCMLVSGRMIGNVDVPEDFDTFPDLILAFLRAGRRRGFLVRVDNRLAVPADRQFDAEALQHETAKILQLFQDYELTSAPGRASRPSG